ncbi:MAG: hypothetical protein NTW29_01665 [Bacteroidetes bacterium]|nr:hypothetical protein [Bacteroidota bacterium]
MTKNLYYRTVFRRANLIKERIFAFFLFIASYPRVLIEVFIRKNFGERYFSLATCFTVAGFLMITPIFLKRLAMLNFTFDSETGFAGMERFRSSAFILYWPWYAFTVVFLVFSFIRWKEIRRNPSVFDFKRFSLHTGDLHPFFYNLTVNDKKPSIRAIETFWEPVGFFVGGLFLYMAGQSLGLLFVVAALCYSLSYYGAYKAGDNFIMDKIDEMILNEEMETAFIGDAPTDQTRGVRFYSRKPTSEELRRRVAGSFTEGNEDDVSVAG